VNLKDTLVLCTSLWLFVALLELGRDRRWRALPTAVACAFVLAFLRWYLPALIVAAFGLWGVTSLRGGKRVAVVSCMAAAFGFQLLRGVPEGYLQPGQALEGTARFLFSPRPWGVEVKYGFLFLPSVMHWIALPFLGYGALELWRRSRVARLVLIYFLLVTAFYALVPELQGPRHRFQVAFVCAWMQFVGLHSALAWALERPRRAARSLPV
jgi:hypothetical protein